MHRVADRSGTLDSLPHNGASCAARRVRSTHRESYLDIVMVGIVSALVALVAYYSGFDVWIVLRSCPCPCELAGTHCDRFGKGVLVRVIWKP
jgi:hypothetical protein